MEVAGAICVILGKSLYLRVIDEALAGRSSGSVVRMKREGPPKQPRATDGRSVCLSASLEG